MENKTKPFYNTTIPNNWDVKKVSEAFDICNNLRLPISETERKKIQGDYPYYGPTKIQDYINEYRLDGTYALIGEDGDHFLKWKDLPMTLLVSGQFNVNNHAHIIQGSNNLTEWFFYYFNHRPLTPYLTRQGAGRYKLTKASLSSILCPIPPINEQYRIVELLRFWDKAINTNNQLIAQKELRKKWLMQNLLTGKKRLKGFKETRWKLKSLEEVASFRNGKGHEKFIDELGKYIVVNSKFISTDGKKKKFSNQNFSPLATNDIVMVMSDIPNGKALAKCYFIDEQDKYTLNQRICCIKADNKTDSRFLYYLLSRNIHYLSFNNGVSQTNLRKEEVIECPLIIPQKEEQTAIAQVLQAADIELSLLKAKTDKLKEQKKGMMQVLLTGKKRLKIKGNEL